MQLSTLAAFAGCGAVAAAAYGVLVEQFAIRVREIELTFPDLPPAFDGSVILHLSDLHITKLGLLERRLMDLVSGRRVDMCFVTGDIAQEPSACEVFRVICSAIKGPETIYGVLGNSEHKPWIDTPKLVQALSFEGFRLLTNDSCVISRQDDSIRIVGVDDAYSQLAEVDRAFRGVDPAEFIVFLTHCPSAAPRAVERGARLILAGHTHGGQVRVPFLGPLWTHMRANKKLNDGLYVLDRLGRRLYSTRRPGARAGVPIAACARSTRSDASECRAVLYVSRGVGTSKLHIRFLCPPEIAYITLRRSP
ncbi:MAG: metallophosphoesterase [Armatimonadota bacterium]